MNLYNIKRKIFVEVIVLAMLLSLSCTKQKRSEIIRNKIPRNDSVINVSNNNEEHKYIINTRTSKVHTYTHGTSIVSERYRLETNENIEKILEDEKYDICLTCRAGLKLNLDNYIKRVDKYQYDDENDLSNKDINLITNYMRIYEFGKLDTETQKFLICIFEVGSWYVNNVYTQLGGQKNVLEIENSAKELASESTYKKWHNYLDIEYYNKYPLKNEKRVLPALYPDNPTTDMVVYRCDLFIDAGYGYGNTKYTSHDKQILKNSEKEIIFEEYKNYCVVDDSSKFAAAVYYHYINKELLKNEKQENRVAKGIDLWDTSSVNFLNESVINNTLLETENLQYIY